MSITFEPPLHPMCVDHQALLISRDMTTSYFNFDKGNLSQCPEVLGIEGKRYIYQGVQDGRAVYREKEENLHELKIERLKCACLRKGKITDLNLPYKNTIAPYGLDNWLTNRDCEFCYGSGFPSEEEG